MPLKTEIFQVSIVGGGPAGLMAAEVLSNVGVKVHLYDAMPSVGRKFLMAGKSGLNLTHNEDIDGFLRRYHGGANHIPLAVRNFSAKDIQDWAHGLGVETFIGSSGRIFPKDYKAAPLLRAWVRRLKNNGVRFHARHRWTGWTDSGQLIFETPDGIKTDQPDATLLALGGASWPELGSDGQWKEALLSQGCQVAPFRPANCGFLVDWSDHFTEKFAGEPVKSTLLKINDHIQSGDFVISSYGIEGSAVYGLSRPLRNALDRDGKAVLMLDLVPDIPLQKLKEKLNRPRGKHSLSNHIRKSAGLKGVKAGLLRECLDKETFNSMDDLAQAIKNLPIDLKAPASLDKAISTAGGLCFESLDQRLMIKARPGTFVAGEMLDWEAPTGGYLLNACFALGRQAAQGIIHWLQPET